jgi:hypothetical protein
MHFSNAGRGPRDLDQNLIAFLGVPKFFGTTNLSPVYQWLCHWCALRRSLLGHSLQDATVKPECKSDYPHALQALWKALDRAEDLIQG